VKLLFDQNLSPFLASRLADIFPESTHVLDVGLDRIDDAAIWNHVWPNSVKIVSKDSNPRVQRVLGCMPLQKSGAL
jgi:predicted nuclease of predicted toxin-antitoxin system